MALQDSEALDELHKHLKAWQESSDQTVDGAELPKTPGVDVTSWPVDEPWRDPDPLAMAESIKRGRPGKVSVGMDQPLDIQSRNGKPVPPPMPPPDTGDVPADVMGDVAGPQEPRAPPGGPSSPRGAMVAAMMGAGKPQPKPPDTSKPLGYSGTEDTELRGLQDKAASDRRMGELGKAVTAFQERPTNQLDAIQQLGGVHPSARQHSTLWDNAGAEGDKAVSDLMERRKSEAGMATAQTAKLDAAKMADPNSDESKFAQSLVAKYAPGVDVTGKSAAQIGKFAPFVIEAMKQNGEAVKEAGKGKGNEDADRRALILSPVYAADLKKIGMTSEQVNGMSGKALEGLEAQLKTNTTNAATVEAGRASASIAAARSLGNAKDLKEWENNLPKNMPPEFVDQLEGLKGSDAAIAQFEKNLGKTSTLMGKAGNALGGLGASQGYLGKEAGQGATFEGDRQRSAIALARGLEGGMARPGNVEIIEKILPHANDGDEVKAQRLQELKDFMDSKKKAFGEAMQGGNYKPVKTGEKAATGDSVRMKFPNGSTADVPVAEVEEAKSHGGVAL